MYRLHIVGAGHNLWDPQCTVRNPNDPKRGFIPRGNGYLAATVYDAQRRSSSRTVSHARPMHPHQYC